MVLTDRFVLSCSMRSTSSTSGWWSASLPTQVTTSIHPLFLHPLEFRTIPHHLLSSPTHQGSFQASRSSGVQGPICEIGSGHGRWGISKTTPLTTQVPSTSHQTGKSLQLYHVCLVFVSTNRASELAGVHAGCRRRACCIRTQWRCDLRHSSCYLVHSAHSSFLHTG